MEVGPDRTRRSLSFGFVVVGLIAISAGLLAMVVITTQAASAVGDMPAKKLLARLAWLSLTLLLLNLLLLFWVVLRHLRDRFRATRLPRRSEYVDVWALAGKRIQLEKEDAEEGEAGEDSADDDDEES